jgi:hypothetical protein
VEGLLDVSAAKNNLSSQVDKIKAKAAADQAARNAAAAAKR